MAAPLIWMNGGQKSLSPWFIEWVTECRHASDDQLICDFLLITAFDAYFHRQLNFRLQLRTVTQSPHAPLFQGDCCSSLGSSSGGETYDLISAAPTVHYPLRSPWPPLSHLLGKCINYESESTQFTLTIVILLFKDGFCPRAWNLQITVLIDLLFLISIELLLVPPPWWLCQVVLLFHHPIHSRLLQPLLLTVICW